MLDCPSDISLGMSPGLELGQMESRGQRHTLAFLSALATSVSTGACANMLALGVPWRDGPTSIAAQ